MTTCRYRAAITIVPIRATLIHIRKDGKTYYATPMDGMVRENSHTKQARGGASKLNIGDPESHQTRKGSPSQCLDDINSLYRSPVLVVWERFGLLFHSLTDSKSNGLPHWKAADRLIFVFSTTTLLRLVRDFSVGSVS